MRGHDCYLFGDGMAIEQAGAKNLETIGLPRPNHWLPAAGIMRGLLSRRSELPVMFEIQPMSPELYRQQTRRSTLVIAVLFLALAMLCSTLSTQLLGTPGGDNFKWNLLGVLAGLALTVAIVRQFLWSQPFMAAAAYGWGLKRSLMRVTNVMHHVKAGVAAGDDSAYKLLRFYHLGLQQMYQLDGNSSELSQLVREIDTHRELMEQRGLELEQKRLDPAWIETVKGLKV